MTSSADSSPAFLRVFDVRAYGAAGDGCTLDAEAINRAMAAAAAAGGGTVRVPAGEYLCHSLRLKSGVALDLAAGATIIAAEPPPLGQPGGYDAPEASSPNLYQDFGHSRFRNSLLWGENLTDVTIRGAGCIYGRGLSRGNGRIALPLGQVAPQPPGHLPDVLEADGPITPDPAVVVEPGRFGYPHALDTLPAGVGNKTIALRGCRNVAIRGITILHGGHFGVLATNCDGVVVEDVLIDTNRDGIDIDGCANVRITRCRVNSPWDDGICIKSSLGGGMARPVENVVVEDCYVSGFVEGTLHDGTKRREIQHRGGPLGRIKLGTEGSGGFRNIAIRDCTFEYCRGLALEQVDGSFMENVVVTNLTMRDVMNAPIFIRLGARLRAPGATAPGTVRRISIRGVDARGVAPDHGIFIAGLPGHPVENVEIADVRIETVGGGTAEMASRVVPELPAGYPEPMLFGVLPAWGIFVRHARDLRFCNLTFTAKEPDARPLAWLEDATDSSFVAVNATGGTSVENWELRGCARIVRTWRAQRRS